MHSDADHDPDNEGPNPITAALRALPRVDTLAAELGLAMPGVTISPALRVLAARAVIDEVRVALRSGEAIAEHASLVARAIAWIDARRRPALRRVLNATGVIVHTNLGRAPLTPEALAEVMGYVNLEYDLAAGARGSRRGAIEPLLLELFAAPDGAVALVTNNNAAAVMLALAALIEGPRREVIVSRGELVEIGGSFRVPDVLATSGATLREVGTTNKTYAADYARAIGPDCAALMRVHPSNYRVSGFVARPSVAELVAVARRHGLPLVVDLGSDAPGELPPALAADAERAHAVLAAGADLVCFSGDKLLGGPQCGIVLGERGLVERMARHPLMRALRPDKLVLGALEHTLRAYLLGEAGRCNPTYIMMHADRDGLRARAQAIVEGASGASEGRLATVETSDPIGGGAHPDVTLPGWGVAITRAPIGLAAALRAGEPPIVALTQAGAVVLALRTLPEDADAQLVAAINRALDSLGSPR